MSEQITPFRIDIPEADIEDLRQRLRQTRWPEPETVGDWSQGVPLAYLRELCEYWLESYDWRRCEESLNRIPQFHTEIDGVDIHFLHVTSPQPGALGPARPPGLSRRTDSRPRCSHLRHYPSATSRSARRGARE